jgi:CRISPR-associated protein Cmr1
MTMISSSYTIRFLTPAFLGDAAQNAVWRTPPFKALLRQWWRVAVAQAADMNVSKLREREAELFGSVSGSRAQRSQVLLRLDSQWSKGTLKDWSGMEAGRVSIGQSKLQVNPQVYLGYGPLLAEKGGRVALKSECAIKDGEQRTLRLAFPDNAAGEIQRALWLMDRYGTVGGRSRNGWGSFSLTSVGETAPLSGTLDESLKNDWREALRLDWPNAIGTDEKGPLLWATLPRPDWKSVMRELARIKIGLRTQFKFSASGTHDKPEARHWLAYPVTKHEVRGWKNLRLPNSLRFKVRMLPDKSLQGIVVHLPCRPPKPFDPDDRAIAEVWRRVYSYLDQTQVLQPQRLSN